MPTSRLTIRARELRADTTRAERLLWWAVRNHQLGGWKWRRQAPVGPFVVDFLCPKARLVVELDGGQHSEQIAYDDRRTAWLSAQGLKVLRFWNDEVISELTGVCDTILAACGGERPSPSQPLRAGPLPLPAPRGEGSRRRGLPNSPRYPSPPKGEREGPGRRPGG